MKILAIGDFHGKFPVKLISKIKKENFDIIVSPGDYCGNNELGRLFFKYVYGTDKELWQFISKRKENQLERKNFESGGKILQKLNNLNKKVIGVTGNWDPTNWHEVGISQRRDKRNYPKKFKTIWKKLKNIKIIDFNNYKFSGYNFVAYPRGTYPGRASKHITKKFKKRFGKEARKIFNKIKEDNKKFYKKLKNKFEKGKNSANIFVSHNVPYNTKIDKLKQGPQKGRHYGSYLVKQVIKDLKPILVICGHMHEYQKKIQVGRSKTWVVNPGPAYEGKAAIIELDDKKKKVKSVRFLR